MNIVSEIQNWSNEVIAEGVFVVEIEWKAGNKKIAVYIDGDQPVTIEQCRQLSRFLSGKLDELDYGETPYQLEVSTPGVDKPLKMQRQYAKHIGRELLVKLKENTEILGKLTEVSEEQITLMMKDKKKGYLPNATKKSIALADISESMVQVSFK